MVISHILLGFISHNFVGIFVGILIKKYVEMTINNSDKALK